MLPRELGQRLFHEPVRKSRPVAGLGGWRSSIGKYKGSHGLPALFIPYTPVLDARTNRLLPALPAAFGRLPQSLHETGEGGPWVITTSRIREQAGDEHDGISCGDSRLS